ncbi:MAG: division plane positioning ATPase MipZ [Pseudomonadota bacterium]
MALWRRPAPARAQATPPSHPCRVIVIANEKGGVGKSTVAALISTAMLYYGARVAVMDVDLRQQSLSRFFANRRRWLPAAGVEAPIPLEYKLTDDTAALAEADPQAMVGLFERALTMAMKAADVVVIDTPGGDTPLTRSAHLQADLVVTPMNDSFVDFDMLGVIDPLTLKVLRPSVYSKVVHDARRRRAEYGRALDWVVLRNRLAPSDTRNRERVGAGIHTLAEQIGFRVGPSLRDRVAYREMFPFGLTVADLSFGLRPSEFSIPRKAAKEEVRALLETLGLIAPDTPAE